MSNYAKTKVNEYNSAIAELKNGVNRDAVIIDLVTSCSISISLATGIVREAAKNLGMASKRGPGADTFRFQFYAWITESPRSDSQIEKYINENGTGNDIRHLSQYKGIAKMARDIHNIYLPHEVIED